MIAGSSDQAAEKPIAKGVFSLPVSGGVVAGSLSYRII